MRIARHPNRTRCAEVCALLSIAAGGIECYAQERSNAGAPTAEILREWRAIEDRQLGEIDAEIAANGPFSQRLYEMYFSLAAHYRERGDHAETIEVLDKALHVTRVAYGLFSMEQVAAMRALIESNLAVGELERVADLDAQLMRIAWQNLDDARSARVFEETADRQLQVFERYAAGELPPQFSINIDAGPPRPKFDSNRYLGMSNLAQARRNYRQAIAVLRRTDTATDGQILALETRLIESYFMEAQFERERAMRSESIMTIRMRGGQLDSLFERGERIYQRMLARASAADDVELAATAMIGLADWNLLFSKNSTALRLYSEAFEALQKLGATQRYLDEVFAPDVPVVLPTFNANPLARAQTKAAQTEKFINVSMVMSRYGRSLARDLSTSADPSLKNAEDAIRRIVTTSRFRPRFVDGEPQSRIEIEFRYYVESQEAPELLQLSLDSG